MKKLLVLVALVMGAVAPSAAGPALPYVQGPDILPVNGADVIVTAIKSTRFECTERAEKATVTLPEGEWDRIILVTEISVHGDPWDRLFGVSIGGVEVLRGTTPRTDMMLSKDITEYARLLPSGGETEVALYMGSYVGALVGSVRLEFYDGEPTSALVAAPRGAIPAFSFEWLDGNQSTIVRDVTFPATAPTSATAEITLSGHANEEFWWLGGTPRTMHILADGVEVATATPMPYVYALLGFGNDYANTACSYPGTSIEGQLIHQAVWWTGQRVLDLAGVHTGTGEIPPYRAELDAESLALLKGAREIRVIQEGGLGRWLMGLSFLLN